MCFLQLDLIRIKNRNDWQRQLIPHRHRHSLQYCHSQVEQNSCSKTSQPIQSSGSVLKPLSIEKWQYSPLIQPYTQSKVVQLENEGSLEWPGQQCTALTLYYRVCKGQATLLVPAGPLIEIVEGCCQLLELLFFKPLKPNQGGPLCYLSAPENLLAPLLCYYLLSSYS